MGGGVLVEIQQPVQCLLADVGRVGGGGEVAGVGADQVVHAVAAVAGLGQQALAMQSVQVPGGFPQGVQARAAA